MPNQITQVKELVKDEVLDVDLITGIGIEGDIIVVTVRSQEAKQTIREQLANKIAGYNTRVKVAGDISLMIDRRAKHRPVVGGISAMAKGGTAGTLGGFAYTRSGDLVAVSNAHVFAKEIGEGKSEEGIEVIQPSPQDGGNSGDVIGELREWTPYTMDSPNAADAAYIEPEKSIEIDPVIIGHNDKRIQPKGVKPPEEGMKCKRFGRTSVDDVVITSVSFDVKVADVRFTDQILFEHVDGDHIQPIEGGDSGSYLLSEDNYVVGLCFAGSDSSPYVGIATPISNVMGILNLGITSADEEPPSSVEGDGESSRVFQFMGGTALLGLALTKIR